MIQSQLDPLSFRLVQTHDAKRERGQAVFKLLRVNGNKIRAVMTSVHQTDSGDGEHLGGAAQRH